MSYIRFLRYMGVSLILFSLTLGFMLDCGFFSMDEVQTPVATSFVCFLSGIGCLIYADEKLK